jgi:predicted nuclease with TOPRIM domain
VVLILSEKINDPHFTCDVFNRLYMSVKYGDIHIVRDDQKLYLVNIKSDERLFLYRIEDEMSDMEKYHAMHEKIKLEIDTSYERVANKLLNENWRMVTKIEGQLDYIRKLEAKQERLKENISELKSTIVDLQNQ